MLRKRFREARRAGRGLGDAMALVRREVSPEEDEVAAPDGTRTGDKQVKVVRAPAAIRAFWIFGRIRSFVSPRGHAGS